MRSFISSARSLTIEDLKGLLPYGLSALLVTTTALVMRANNGIRAFPSPRWTISLTCLWLADS